MKPHLKAKMAIKVGEQQMDFILECHRQGLCTTDEARRAMQEVHNDTMNKIDRAYLDKKQFMLDRQLEAREVN